MVGRIAEVTGSNLNSLPPITRIHAMHSWYHCHGTDKNTFENNAVIECVPFRATTGVIRLCAQPFITHIDKLRLFDGESRASWRAEISE